MTLLLALAAALPLAGAPAPAPPPCFECLVWEVDAAGAAALGGDSELTGLNVVLTGASTDSAGEAVAALRARGARVGFSGTPDLLAGLPLGEADFVIVTLAAAGAALDAAERVFALRSLVVGWRAAHPGLRVGLEARSGADPVARAMAPYVDFVVGDGTPAAGAGQPWRRGTASSAGELLRAVSRDDGRLLVPWPQAPELAALPLAFARARLVLPRDAAPLGGVAVACVSGAGPAAPPCDAGAFVDASGRALLLVAPPAPVGSVEVSRAGAEAVDPAAVRAWLHDLAAVRPAEPVAVQRRGTGLAISIPLRAQPFLLELEGWGAGQGRFGAGVEVVAGRPLSVEEILARHQAFAARQRRLVPRLISSGRLVIAFQAPGLAGPMTVTAEVVLYTAPQGTEVEQRSLRLNGVPLDGGGLPRLPIVEPERVATPPLAMQLHEGYRYRLEGMEALNGRPCYRVGFEPAHGQATGLRGQAWIDGEQFALARMRAVRSGLRGPIVASEQTDEFAPAAHGGATVWLPSRSTVHQVYEGPGHRTAIDRVLTLDHHQPDPPDFDGRLAAAHASPHVMLRETEQGFVYLRHQADRRPAAEPVSPTRVPAGKATAVVTVALGVLVDPAIGDPLPFAGAGYSDFDFLGTGTQLNAFLAGAFAQVSWAAPSLHGSRWRLQASATASLVAYNDRVFRAGVEQYDENLRQRPARGALELSHPLGTRWRARGSYEIDSARLRRSDLTAPAFVTPAGSLSHSLRLGLDSQQGPWTLSAWWRPSWRPGWRPWGLPGHEGSEPAGRSYQRYGLGAARNAVLSPALVARVEMAALGGRGLDRFSRYSFDAFESRLTGYPVATVRFDRGLILRTGLAWRARPWARLQGFADGATVRDAGFGRARSLAGIGAGLDLVLPLRTLLAAEWGWGLQGRDREGRPGTHTVRVTAYRLF